MIVSTDWRARMESSEIEGTILKAYRDSAGVLTIGTGHTGRMAGPKVIVGMTCTKAQADSWLEADLATTETFVTASLHVPFSQHQFDALCDLAFNIGLGGFRGSTVLRLFNAKNYEGAANALLAWNRAGGRILQGLVRRRALERAWFLEEVLGEHMKAPVSLPLAAHEMARSLNHPDDFMTRLVNRAALLKQALSD